jgi:non-ribosomal peptide synthetase component F
VSERPAEVAGVESMVGLFINTVPLRVRAEPGDDLETILSRVQATQFEVLPYRHLGLTEIQRRMGMGDLFDSYYVFQNYPDAQGPLGASTDLRISEKTLGASGVSHYPLGLTVIPGERIECLFGYHPELFDEPRMEEIKMTFMDLIRQIAGERVS